MVILEVSFENNAVYVRDFKKRTAVARQLWDIN